MRSVLVVVGRQQVAAGAQQLCVVERLLEAVMFTPRTIELAARLLAV